MGRGAVSGVTLALLLGMLTLSLSVQLVEASEVHDVAVTAVETFMTYCGNTYYPVNIVPEGRSVNINATIENQGDFNETFNVTAYANTTIIATLTNITLTSLNSTTLTIPWNTTGIPKGNYTIKALITPLPGETDTLDNTYTDGWVIVMLCGDLDFDGDIDDDDLWIFSSAFIEYWKTGTKDPLCDFDDDCDIDCDDMWYFCKCFSECARAFTRNIAISNVKLYKAIVGKESTTFIDVTVHNEGDCSCETFNVTLYANNTIINQTGVTYLVRGSSKTITITWDTTGFAIGNYTISAYVQPKIDETSTTDNNYTDGGVMIVALLGDLDGDFEVDEDDLWYFCEVFIGYHNIGVKDAFCDFDGDCDIDEDDLWTMYAAFIEYWKS